MKSRNISGLFSNKTTLDKFSERNGELRWNNKPIETTSSICPQIIITHEEGSVITVIKDTTIIYYDDMEVIDEHTVKCKVNDFGTWIIQSRKDGAITEQEIFIDEIKIYYTSIQNITSDITVTFPEGCICRCILGSSVQVSTESPHTFVVNALGTYTIETEYDTNIMTRTEVIISETDQHKTLTVNFPSITVQYSDEFKGVEISCSNGGMTYTKICPDIENEITFVIPCLGTWTITHTDEVRGRIYQKKVIVIDYINYNTFLMAYVLYGFYIDGAGNISYNVQYDGKPVNNINYTAARTEYTYSEYNPRYTFRVNPGSWNLENDFFIPRSCMLNYNGKVAYYLNENDHTLKEDGTLSDISDYTYQGNVMMEFGRDGKIIWTRIVPDFANGGATVYIADEQLDEYFTCWSFLDRDGKKIPHFYISKYEGSYYGGKIRSMSGATPYQSNYNTFNSGITVSEYIQSGNAIYSIEEACDRILLTLLFMLIFKTTNSQEALGMGQCLVGTVGSGPSQTGTLNKVGMFYGEYLTGTSEVPSSSVNLNKHFESRIPIKFLGIENFYSGLPKLLSGYFMVGQQINSSNRNNWLRFKPFYSKTNEVSSIGNTNTTGYGFGQSVGIFINKLPQETSSNVYTSYLYNVNAYSRPVFHNNDRNLYTLLFSYSASAMYANTDDKMSASRRTYTNQYYYYYPVQVGGSCIKTPFRYNINTNNLATARDNGILAWSVAAETDGLLYSEHSSFSCPSGCLMSCKPYKSTFNT